MNRGCAQEIIPSRPTDPSSIKVVVLGLPCTGVQALSDALGLLGISPVYRMREVSRNTHALLWCRAIEAKSDPDTPSWDRFKFDQLLSGYQAVADYPAAIFAEDILEAYPAASVIVTTTSEDSWAEDMSNSLIHAHAQQSPDDQSPMATLARTYHKYCWDNDFESNGRQLFRKHSDLVRTLAEGRKFLEVRPGDGWEPLCEFLGLPIPADIPYPVTDDKAEYGSRG